MACRRAEGDFSHVPMRFSAQRWLRELRGAGADADAPLAWARRTQQPECVNEASEASFWFLATATKRARSLTHSRLGLRAQGPGDILSLAADIAPKEADNPRE